MSLPLIADNFAGGGGASTGIERALGRPVDVAINHDAAAVAMHAANHPGTRHHCQNIYRVDPLDVTGGRHVGLAWFSPDCKHHSKAKGGKPVERNVRDLAWVVVLWAKRVAPEVIILENVEEFADWGPLIETPKGLRPCPERKGETFRKWVGSLRRLGYKVHWRELVAADYGAPTTRKRLFLIARRDGRPIIWPQPTHGRADDVDVIAGRKLPWRSAASIIDWSLPCPSIFDTSEEIMARHGLRAKRPLAEPTLRRVARGVVRYVLDAAEPFVVRFNGGSTGSAMGDPLGTVTANSYVKRPGGAPPLGLAVPSIVPITHRGDDRVHDSSEPLRTVTTAHRGEFALAATTLVQSGYGEREGQAPRSLDPSDPLGTVVACGAKHAAVAAFLAQHNEGNVGHPATRPVSTIVQRGCTQGLAAVHLQSMHGSDRRDLPADGPLGTVCAGGGHAAAVAAFLVKYYGQGSQHSAAGDPLHTVVERARHGLVTVTLHGRPYVVADIGLRMLTPRELFRAQGFPDSYCVEDVMLDGRPLTKSRQIACAGNSVCPPVAEAIVRANCAHLVADGPATLPVPIEPPAFFLEAAE